MKKNSRARQGITFIEIMIAVLIMAVALMPIFFMINKGTEDTDLNSANAYALNKASEILNTLLDSVPFETLREGIPGTMCSRDLCALNLPEYSGTNPSIFKLSPDFAENMTKMLFGENRAGGPVPDSWNCNGVVTDPRGISYLITLMIEDIADTQAIPTPIPEIPGEFPEVEAVTLSFMLNPKLLSQPNWVASYVPTTTGIKTLPGSSFIYPRYELEQVDNVVNGLPQVAAPKKNVYEEADFKVPLKKRLSQKLIVDPVRYNAVNKFVCLKRLILEVQWNMEKKFFSQPDSTTGNIQRIHLIALKGDVAR